MNKKLTVIIVNYNTAELLQSCLNSLYHNYARQLKSGSYEIIVVDNASDDNSFKATRKNFPQLKIISNKINLGFAKANNQAIKLAQGEYVLLLNPDTLVYKKTLTRLLAYMRHKPEVAITTCKIILPNGQIDDASHRGFPTPWRAMSHFLGLGRLLPFTKVFNGYHLGYQNMERIHEIDARTGAFMLVRKVVGERVGWLDEDYFWYGDDLDFCYRVKNMKFKVMYVPEVSILHYKGAASGIKRHSRHLSKADWKTRFQAHKARFEVMRIFYRKHYQHLYPLWLTKLVLLAIDIKEKLSLQSI